MNFKVRTKISSLILITLISGQIFISAQSKQTERFKYPDLSKGRGLGSKSDETQKLSSELRILSVQFRNRSRGLEPDKYRIQFSESQLKDLFDLNIAEEDPSIDLTIATERNADLSALTEAGLKIYLRTGNTIYGKAPVSSLRRLAGEKSVIKISPVTE